MTEYTFVGVRSFVPHLGMIVKGTFPTLRCSDAGVTLGSWSTRWEDISEVLWEPKAILIRKADGTSARFKASRRTISKVLAGLNGLGVNYSRSMESTYWMVSAEETSANG